MFIMGFPADPPPAPNLCKKFIDLPATDAYI